MITEQNVALKTTETSNLRLKRDFAYGLQIHDASVRLGQILANSPVVAEDIVSHFMTIKSSGNPVRWSRVHSFNNNEIWSTYSLAEFIKEVPDDLLELINGSIDTYNSCDNDQFIQSLGRLRFTYRYISSFKTQIEALKSIHSIMGTARSKHLLDSSIYEQIEMIASRDLDVDVSLAVQMALDFQEEHKSLRHSVDCLVTASMEPVKFLIRQKNISGFIPFQEGLATSNLALVDCAHRYNPFRATQFITFARYYVIEALRKSSIVYSLPATVRQHCFQNECRLMDKLAVDGNAHTENEWSLLWLQGNMMGPANSASIQDDESDIADNMNTASNELDSRFKENYDLVLGTEDVCEREEFSRVLSKALDILNPREKEIITGKFINGNCTSENLAERYGVTPSRISQIIITATKKLSAELGRAGYQSLSDLGLNP